MAASSPLFPSTADSPETVSFPATQRTSWRLSGRHPSRLLGRRSVYPPRLASLIMSSNPQTSASSGSQAGPHKERVAGTRQLREEAAWERVLLALKGEQLNPSFIYTKSRFLPFNTALLFRRNIMANITFTWHGWFIHLPLQPQPLLSPSSPPRPQDCFQHKCWGHHGLFVWKLLESF